MEKEESARVINSHVISCPSCKGDYAVAVVWDDGDVDVLCTACKHTERLSGEE